MLFIEFKFLVFFAVVWILVWSIRANLVRKWILLFSSYLFYAAWDYRFLPLIPIFTAVNYFSALGIHRSDDRAVRLRWLLLSLVFNMMVLFYFKYFKFFISSFGEWLSFLGVGVDPTILNIILPVGISFYVFQGLSYPLDVYHRNQEPQGSFLDFALFSAFFPQLIAGPIVRGREFLPQLQTTRRLDEINIRACLTLFLVGFTKKAAVADMIAPHIDPIFTDPYAFGSLDIFYGQLLYSIQIYCDFSGYSDMAIATAGLLGYTIPINFNFPYFARNISDFWRRWHISLSSWLHDYIYLPLFFLGRDRFQKNMIYRNLLITMFLCGLWHGAAWGYAIFGIMHGGSLILHQEWQRFCRRRKIKIKFDFGFSVLLTFYWVCWTFVYSRARDAGVAWQLTVGTFFTDTNVTKHLTINAPLIFIVLAVVHWCFYRWKITEWISRQRPWVLATGLGCWAAVAVAWIPVAYRPFIYFQF